MFFIVSVALAQAPLQEAEELVITEPTVVCDAVVEAAVLPARETPVRHHRGDSPPDGRVPSLLAEACPGVLAGADAICITVESREDEQCLGYVDSHGQWQCEDAARGANADGAVCGKMRHFMTLKPLWYMSVPVW